MRIIFMGSAGFACPCLERLLASSTDEVVAVVTQPDRPKGRNLEVSSCPVKKFLGDRQIPVLNPERVNTPESIERLQSFRPELIVVVAYGQLLKPALLALPPRGCVNVHGSLLPRYRGAAPIQWAIANGDAVSGVSTMFMDSGMDTGDVILKRELPIGVHDTGGTYHDKLSAAGAELLGETIELIRKGAALRIPQDHASATIAPKLRKVDGRLDWTRPARELHNHIRGFNPWPGTFCDLPGNPGKTLKVTVSRIEPGSGAPGTLIEADGDGLLIQTSDQALRLLEVQPEGRKPMSGAAFLRGYLPAIKGL
ncbi:MAG: methionyl-tRNA formyltransferase [bacterium]